MRWTVPVSSVLARTGGVLCRWAAWASERTWTLLAFAVPLLLAAAYGGAHFWICDDAHISFRYAQQLLQGHGLVYNVGERVEGYTNLLWVLETAALQAVGIPLRAASVLLSSVATLGVFVLTAMLARTTPIRAFAAPAVFAAWVLLATNRNVAVWTTSGLETRQFTFLVLLAVVLLRHYGRRPRALVWTSVAMTLATLTRPEGLLLFAGFVFYYVLDSAPRRLLGWLNLLRLVLPFTIVVGAQFVGRRLYYGEWLPNTYTAKFVRPWSDSGLLYYCAAVLESGLYLSVPLAVVGAALRWVRGRDSLHVLSALLIVPHALYFIRVGGDHFEFRILDFYWPLLALATADGLVALAFGARLLARRSRWALPRLTSKLAGGAALSIVLLYSTVLQVAQFVLEYPHRDDVEFPGHLAPKLTEASFPPVFAVPFMEEIGGAYQRSMDTLIGHAVAVRWIEHRVFQQMMESSYAPYQAHRELLPRDSVMSSSIIGIMGFSLPEVTIIDERGLTDRTVARSPVASNGKRVMAHDRSPPPGYLESRGRNIVVYAASASLGDALDGAPYAVRLGPKLWASVDSPKPHWFRRAFSELPYTHLPPGRPHRAVIDGRRAVSARTLLDCEAEPQGWSVRGMVCGPSASAGDQRVTGQGGRRWLTSYLKDSADAGRGQATSPEFVARPGSFLVFRVAGGASERLGVALVDERERRLMSWRGETSEQLKAVVQHLDRYEGQRLHVQVFDDEPGGWGHIVADDISIIETDPNLDLTASTTVP